VPFRLVTLETAVAALAAVPGGDGPATYLAERYLAFGRVHRLVLGADLPPLPRLERGGAAARTGEPGPRAGAGRGGRRAARGTPALPGLAGPETAPRPAAA
jgi:hypothetical protein